MEAKIKNAKAQMPRPACRQAGNIQFPMTNAKSRLTLDIGHWDFPGYLNFVIFNFPCLS